MKLNVILSPQGLPQDTLSGHRQRFIKQFEALKSFYSRTSTLIYFKHYIQVPSLPKVRSILMLCSHRFSIENKRLEFGGFLSSPSNSFKNDVE